MGFRAWRSRAAMVSKREKKMSVNFQGCAFPRRTTADGAAEEGFIVMSHVRKLYCNAAYEAVRRAIKKSYGRGARKVMCRAFVVEPKRLGGTPRYYVKQEDAERIAEERKRAVVTTSNSRQPRSGAACRPAVKLCGLKQEDPLLALAKSVHEMILPYWELLEDYITRPNS